MTRTSALVISILVVSLLGSVIVVSMASPGFLNVINREQQKQSMADIRTLGTCIEAYAVDNAFYPDAHSIEDLRPHLEGPYIREVTVLDGWKHPFGYDSWIDDSEEPAFPWIDGSGGQLPTHYRIGSAGHDGVWQHKNIREYRQGVSTTNFDCDIIYETGVFIQWPEGIQTLD